MNEPDPQSEIVPNRSETHMRRYECMECDMTAQGPLTYTFEDAWSFHMFAHGENRSNYGQWDWTVVPLPRL